MRVKLRVLYCGPKRIAQPGEEIDVPDEEAKQLIDGKYATPVGAQMETAAFGNRRGERAVRQPRQHE